MHPSDSLWVGVEDLLHLEVRRRVDGVNERPLVIEGDVRVLQFAIDRAEALDHDALPDLDILLQLALSIVASGGDEVAVEVVALRIADDQDGEHIHLLGIELGERRQLHLLLLTTCLTHVADGRIGRAMLGEDLQKAIELPVATLALGIIDRRDEIPIGCSLDTLLDA